MFRRIESQMALLGLNKKDLASLIGLKYNTLLAKLRGERPFSLDEAVMIKKALNIDDSVEELFKKQETA